MKATFITIVIIAVVAVFGSQILVALMQAAGMVTGTVLGG